MTLGPIPGSASSEPISQSIGGVRVFTFASCPAVGSALAGGAKASAAMPSPASAILFITGLSQNGLTLCPGAAERDRVLADRDLANDRICDSRKFISPCVCGDRAGSSDPFGGVLAPIQHITVTVTT